MILAVTILGETQLTQEIVCMILELDLYGSDRLEEVSLYAKWTTRQSPAMLRRYSGAGARMSRAKIIVDKSTECWKVSLANSCVL